MSGGITVPRHLRKLDVIRPFLIADHFHCDLHEVVVVLLREMLPEVGDCSFQH